MANSIELTRLLEEAKKAELDWEAWENVNDIYDRSSPLAIAQSLRHLWTKLHIEMLQSEPLTLTLVSGAIRQARTIGTLTEDLLLYYAESPNARYTLEAVNLRFVMTIEKIEDDN